MKYFERSKNKMNNYNHFPNFDELEDGKEAKIKELATMPIESITPEMVVKIMVTDDFTSSIWEITPTIAKVLLKANTKNRAIRRTRVEQYKADIINGRWAQNGEAICFKKNGQLSDGQHRLVAVSESGIMVKMNVAVGCDDYSDHTYDSGLNRTNADCFKYNDIVNYNGVSSIVSRYFILKHRAPFISTHEQHVANNVNLNARITRSVLLEEYAKTPSLCQEICKTAIKLYERSRILKTSEIGGMILYLVKDLRYDYDFVTEFFVGLTTDGWYSNDTVATLRMKLTRAAITKNTVMSRQYKQALIIKAWNAYASNINISRLSYDEKKEGKIWFNHA